MGVRLDFVKVLYMVGLVHNSKSGVERGENAARRHMNEYQ